MKKKILLIHHSGSIGGAGLSFIHLLESIDQSKFEIHVLCPNKPDNMLSILKEKGYKVTGLKNSPKIFPHYNGGITYAFSIRTIINIFELIKDSKKIEKYITDINPDILIVNSMTLFWIGKITKKMNIKTICFNRETYLKGMFGFRTKIIKNGLSKWFDSIVFISKNDYFETGKTLADKRVIYDRVDLKKYSNIKKEQARKQLGFDPKKKYILYLGGFSKLKGSHIIMNAMKNIKDENISLVFVGGVENIEDIRKKTNFTSLLKRIFKMDQGWEIYKIYKKYNLKNRIIFRKKVTDPELYYKACDLVVFPSTKAHQARPIYEAGIARIPIIITDFPQTSEFTNNSAITFKNKDSYDLAKKIVAVLTGKIDVKSFIDNNYRQTMDFHNLDTLKDDLEQLLREYTK